MSQPLARDPRYGCIPDHPDHRDLMFAAPPVDALPDKVDLSEYLPPVMNQGNIGSCTAHGSIGGMRAAMIKAGIPDLDLSRLFGYYNARAIEGSTGSDSGAMIRDAVKGLVNCGAPKESDWPYDTAKFREKPPAVAYTDGEQRQVLEYQRVPIGADTLKAALAAGFPVIIGISLYQSFESVDVARTGIVPMPRRGERMIGGHCMLCFGYDAVAGVGFVRNSWGEGWGDRGNCRIPLAYLDDPNLASDFWTITKVEA